MLKSLAACVLVLLGSSRDACAQDYDDGADHAQAGIPQRAGALDNYPTRPPWRVAGVDYPVGIPAGTDLRSPTSIHLKGVTIQPTIKLIAVSDDGVVLDRYDFAGWQVELLAGATNLRIERSRFLASPLQKLALVYAERGGTVTLAFNTFDGGGASSASNPLFMAGSGGATVAYNHFIHVPNDAINIVHDGVFNIHNNLFDSLNYGEGHTDCVQTYFSALTSLKVNYNTVYQPAPDSSGFPGAGNSFVRVGDEHGKVVRRLEIANNTLLFLGPRATSFANVFDISAGGGSVISPSVHDNFIDPTGILYGIWSPYADELSYPVYADNYDLSTNTRLLAGRYNSRSAGVPAALPARPRISRVSRGPARVTITGTAAPGTTVSVTAGADFLGAVRTAADGTWTVATIPPRSATQLRVRSADAWGNASAPTSLDLMDLGADGIDPP